MLLFVCIPVCVLTDFDSQPPYMPPVSDKTDLGHIDQSFVEEQPDLDLGDDDEDVEAGNFDNFTFENPSALRAAN